jgi:hypothetical protein
MILTLFRKNVSMSENIFTSCSAEHVSLILSQFVGSARCAVSEANVPRAYTRELLKKFDQNFDIANPIKSKIAAYYNCRTLSPKSSKANDQPEIEHSLDFC